MSECVCIWYSLKHYRIHLNFTNLLETYLKNKGQNKDKAKWCDVACLTLSVKQCSSLTGERLKSLRRV